MPKVYPTKSQYEEALKVVKEYEDRQATLKRLKEDLSFHLQKFNSVKFNVDKKQGRVLFSGSLKENSQVVIGESICVKTDVFNETIGKLIAVKKSLKLDISDILEHVEVKYKINLDKLKWVKCNGDKDIKINKPLEDMFHEAWLSAHVHSYK